MLRLLLRGHDVKSVARELSISTAAANERLRSARLKLGVSSSREAARILSAEESGPDSSVDRQIGLAAAPASTQNFQPWFGWIGVVMAAFIASGIALMAVVGAHGTRTDAPHVVRTYPAPGAEVPPGRLKLSVTFDRPMRPGNFSFVRKDAATYPDCGQNVPAQSADGKTFSLDCTVKPGRSYEVWFNSPPYMNFKDVDGTPAVPFQLRFRTRNR